MHYCIIATESITITAKQHCKAINYYSDNAIMQKCWTKNNLLDNVNDAAQHTLLNGIEYSRRMAGDMTVIL